MVIKMIKKIVTRVLNGFRAIKTQIAKKNMSKSLPLHGYPPSEINSKYLNLLDDEDLKDLNEILDWNCFISDNSGRRFGMAAWGTKRTVVQAIPDPRIVKMHDRFNLTNQRVLEVGCFEGVHTLGLLQYTQHVTAVDARIDHIVKTLVRCAMFGFNPTVFKYDVESRDADKSLVQADYLHHVGVLYHLRDPIRHLLELGQYIEKGLMLDTHYCLETEVNGKYEVDGSSYSYKHYLEYGRKEAFSGMYDHSKWLLLDDIVNCLKQAGFNKVEIIEKRAERNGHRVLLFAEKLN
jgi:tRNA (mo5U34)-methyltransferase